MQSLPPPSIHRHASWLKPAYGLIDDLSRRRLADVVYNGGDGAAIDVAVARPQRQTRQHIADALN